MCGRAVQEFSLAGLYRAVPVAAVMLGSIGFLGVALAVGIFKYPPPPSFPHHHCCLLPTFCLHASLDCPGRTQAAVLVPAR